MTMAPLLGRLRETASAEGDARLAAAREEARRLIDDARERLSHRREARLRTRTDELARERDRRLHEAREAAARQVLAAGEQLMERVVARALERAVRWAGDPRSASWASSTAAAALDYLPEGTVTIRTTPSAAPLLATSVTGGRHIRVDVGQSPLGMTLESGDGRVVVDATIEQFLRVERQRLGQAVIAAVRERPA